MQIIQEKSEYDRPKAPKKSIAQRLGEGLGVALEGGQQLMAQYQQKQAVAEQDEKRARVLQQLTGHDLRGLNEDMQKDFLKMSMQGQQANALELIKQEAKNQALEQKHTRISEILGSPKKKSFSFAEQIAKEEKKFSADPEERKLLETLEKEGFEVPVEFDAKKMSDAQIAEISVEDPQLANLFQKQKDVALREQRAEQEAKEKRMLQSEQIDYQSFKDNKEYTEKVLTGYEGYKRDKQALGQMEAIASKKGALPTPLAVSMLNKLGLPLGVLENPDAEQFDKLSQELMKGISGTYGNRILQSEVQNFMRSIPTLLSSPEGRVRLIDQWNILNEGKKIYYDAYKEVKKENPKRLPPDMHERVIEKSEDKLDLLANQFRNMNESATVKMRAPNGKILNIPRDQVEKAKKAGGELME